MIIETKAIVSRIEAGQVWIRSEKTSACGSCSQKMSCAIPSVEQMLARREFKVECAFPVKIGQTLKVCIDDSHLLSIAALLYLLPLLLMFGGVFLAEFILPSAASESWLPIIALSILLLTFRLIYRCQNSLLNSLGSINIKKF